MEKKFTRAMLCEEFKSKCRECPLFCDNNFKSLPCWLLDESDVQNIMNDYPYTDVKVRIIFNDIETRLAAVEKKVEEKERDDYKELFHSLNHKHQKVVGEMKAWKERAIEAEKNEVCLKRRFEKPEKLRTVLERENAGLRATLEAVTKDRDKINYEYNLAKEKLKITKEKYDDACKMNKMREDVFESNLKLKKTIEAKDREIDLLRAELDKYKTDDECDDRWID